MYLQQYQQIPIYLPQSHGDGLLASPSPMYITQQQSGQRQHGGHTHQARLPSTSPPVSLFSAGAASTPPAGSASSLFAPGAAAVFTPPGPSGSVPHRGLFNTTSWAPLVGKATPFPWAGQGPERHLVLPDQPPTPAECWSLYEELERRP
ncbi:hypothetical protein PAPYR_7013 [Paratrimastix pyriformis]|uniref:Uncharacterized protein n=1 Tax=Paratrimastix pyriformis TaxID=342808 RepID=A0ABQ8UJB7_9EUKA|nr:hypothetical protein PAPYR_7013 [Paratrimastix pyriformis]